jgi:dihydroorotate dehydrogenase (NAD+) catalytic subunit
VRAIALAQVRDVCQRVSIPAVGMGGIASGREARDFLLAGARCVAVGTENFKDPAAGRRIAAELDLDYRNERGFLSTARV